MTQGDLVGTWELVSRETTSGGNVVLDPWYGKQSGRLIFTGDGWVAAFIGMPNRAPLNGNDPYGGSNEDLAGAGQGWMSYCGRYTFQDGIVTIHYQLSFFPNWEGMDHKRYVHLDGDTLTVTTDPVTSHGESRVTTLVWKRLT